MINFRPIGQMRIGLYFGLALALFYAAVGLRSGSVWFITLSVYYAVLSAARYFVLYFTGSFEPDPARLQTVRRCCGVMLMLLSVCLAGTVVLSVLQNRGTKHHEIVMITIACCTFTKLTLACIRLFQANDHGTVVTRLLRNLSFADALASIFSLQRSMLASFGEMSPETVTLFNLLTGSGVSLLVLLLGIDLIGKENTMAKSKLVETNEKIAEAAVKGYSAIENAVVDGYKKVEDAVVGTYTKMEDRFVSAYLTKEGETVEEAKARLKGESEEK